jgi:PAS domain S-box-containing protein
MLSKKGTPVLSRRTNQNKASPKVAGADSRTPRSRSASKKSEAARHESEKYLRRFYESGLVGVIFWNMNGQIVDANDKFLNLLGYSREELEAGKIDWINMTPPEFRPLDEASVAELKEVGVNKIPFEKEYFRKDGSRMPILLAGAMLDEERFNGVAFIVDITEQKQMGNALKESETKYRMLFDNAQIGMYRTRLDSSAFLEVNDKFAEILGFSKEELLGSAGRIRWATPETRDTMLGQLKNNGGVLSNYEAQLIAKNGEVKDVLASIELHPREGYLEGTISDVTEHKRAEKALLKSESRYRVLLDAMLEGCQVIGFDWRYLYVNEAVAQHGHQEKEALVGHTMMDVYPGIENTELFSVLRRCMNERIPQHMQNEFAYPDGTKGWFELSIQPVPEGIFILSIDISEHKHAEETIRDLARFPSENPNPVLRIGNDGMLIYGNQAAFTLLKPWKLGLNKPAPEILIRLAHDAFTTGNTTTVDIPCGKRTFSVAIAPSPQDKYVNLYARDVTERVLAEQETHKLNSELEERVSERTRQLQAANKQLEGELAEHQHTEEALRESQDQVRRLSEASFEAIAIHDNGVLLSANSQYCQMFGYEPDELPGKQVLPMTVAPEAMEAVKQEIASGSLGPYEATGMRKDGTRFPMEIRVRGMEYEGRKVRVAAIMDITERKQAELALQQRTIQLEAANQELEAFSYSISHDLRSPLRAMDGFSRILLEEYAPQLPAEAQRYLGLVRNNAQQMGHLIEDLLAFSRLSRLPLTKMTVASKEIVNQVVAELREDQGMRKVKVIVGDLPDCQADPALLKQVWVNLIANAFKFTRKREDAQIEIGAKQSDAECFYFVKDNGVGFDMQYAHKLFGVFQRLHRSEDYEGTGVGLAIVQRIVHRHGGRAWGEAQPDKGAIFYFSLEGGIS